MREHATHDIRRNVAVSRAFCGDGVREPLPTSASALAPLRQRKPARTAVRTRNAPGSRKPIYHAGAEFLASAGRIPLQ